MVFKQKQFLKLTDGTILEVIYADEEKAICLKIKQCHSIGLTYTGKCIVISNLECDYDGIPKSIKLVPSVLVTGKYHWEPLKEKITFLMV